jgi:NTE family protein
MVTRPINLLRLPLAMLDRIDVVAFYYNKDLFNRRTYADLAQPKTRPYIVINATNMALGERFEFTQDDFDVLGSDLSTVPVGHAVAASSAFPMLLSPMRLRYYPSPPGSDLYTRLSDPDGARENPRHYAWASSLLPRADAGSERERRLDEENHKYIHLLDGGITDNLGVTFLIQELRFGYIRELIETGKVKKLVVVVVDAGTDRPEPIESMANSPGLFRMALSTGNTGIKNYSSAMTQILRFMMREEPARRRENYKQCTDSIAQSCPQAQRPPRPAALDAEYYLIEVNFREIEDQKERERFLEMPTSFFLRSSQVDALIAQGGQLLADSADYRRLIADLGGALPERCGQCLRAKAPGSSCETCRVPD